MYKIVYIDEQEDARDEFLDFVENKDSDKRFDVETMKPAASLEEMLAQIREIGADALISDYRLNEHIKGLGYPVPYDGVELVNEFLQERAGYPCFVITSFPADAANSSEDVNIVYVKNVLNDRDSADLDFLVRIRIQVDHYRNKIDEAENRIFELLPRRRAGVLSLDEEEELVRLDSFLESTISKSAAVPPELKRPSNENKLSELLLKVDTLLGKMGHDE